MKFLLDECIGVAVFDFLTRLGYDVVNAAMTYSGSEDSYLLTTSVAEDRVVITNDKDFGDLVFRDGELHSGVILLRLRDERNQNKVRCVKWILEELGNDIYGKFIVITDKGAHIQHRIHQ